MNRISSLRKRKNDRYVVEIETKEGKVSHILGENTVIKYNLFSGKELNKEAYKRVVKDNEFELLYLKSINFISYQMRTISEVKKHLRKTSPDESAINKIIERLKKQKFLDDIRYANQYVTQKIEFDLIGPRGIKQKLIQKGIHFDLIDAELIRYTDEIQYNKIYELIQKETKHSIRKPYLKAVNSLKRKCVSKGFDLSIINSSIQSYSDVIQDSCDEESMLTIEFNRLKKGVNLKDYSEKDKLIKKLMQKGFSYQNIKKIIQ